MARRRLSAALLLPEPWASEVRGLRRALGSPSLETQPPHLTLVPPVNVREEAVDDAVAVLRQAAASVRSVLDLTVGPIETFAPVSPVLYLGVTGDLAALHRLQSAVFRGPLHRHVDYDSVPHVTVHESVDDYMSESATKVLQSFQLELHLHRVHLLEQGPDDRVWRPFADCGFGPPIVRGRGGVELHLRWTELAAPDVARLWESTFDAVKQSGQPMLHWLEARDGFGELLGARFSADAVVVTEHLGEGIEDRLLAEMSVTLAAE